MAGIWGADVAISLPTADDSGNLSVPMGGFRFGPGGLGFDMTSADLEEQYYAPFQPEDIPPPERPVE